MKYRLIRLLVMGSVVMSVQACGDIKSRDSHYDPITIDENTNHIEGARDRTALVISREALEILPHHGDSFRVRLRDGSAHTLKLYRSRVLEDGGYSWFGRSNEDPTRIEREANE